MGMTTVLNAAGVDKERFVDYTDKNPATYKVRTSEQGICIIDTNQCMQSLHHDQNNESI